MKKEKEIKECQSCVNKFVCLEKIRLGLETICKTEELEKYEKEEKK